FSKAWLRQSEQLMGSGKSHHGKTLFVRKEIETGRRLRDDLFVVADTTTKIARLGNESHLRNRRFVGARPGKHVADLGDLGFRVLRGSGCTEKPNPVIGS